MISCSRVGSSGPPEIGRGGDPSDRCRRYRRDCYPCRTTPTDRTPTRAGRLRAHGRGRRFAGIAVVVIAAHGRWRVAMNRPDQSAIGGPSPTHDASSSPSNQATPSASPSPTPRRSCGRMRVCRRTGPRRSARARRRRGRPADAAHLPRSHRRHRIDADHWVDLRGVMADTGGVDLRLVSNSAAGRKSHRTMDRIWRRHR